MILKSLKSGSWFAIDRLGAILGALVSQLVIARSLGPSGTGELNALLALVAICSPIAQLGVGWHVSTAIRRNANHEPEILDTALFFRLLGALIAASLIVLFGRFLFGSAGWGAALLLIAASQLPLAFSVIEMRYHATLTLKRLVPWKLLIISAFTLAKVLVGVFNANLSTFLFLIAAETMALGLIPLAVYTREMGRAPRFAPAHPWRGWFGRRAPTLTLAGIAEFAHLKIDILLLSLMLGAAEAGRYSVAARVSEAWYVIAVVVSASLVPLIWTPSSTSETIAKRLQIGFDGLFALGLLIACLLTLFSNSIVVSLFGLSFQDAASILSIHAWAGVFVFMRALLSRWLIENDLPTVSLISHVSALALNIALNLLLIPTYGGEGAAIATVASVAMGGCFSILLVPEARSIVALMLRSLLLPLRWPTLHHYARWVSSKMPGPNFGKFK